MCTRAATPSPVMGTSADLLSLPFLTPLSPLGFPVGQGAAVLGIETLGVMYPSPVWSCLFEPQCVHRRLANRMAVLSLALASVGQKQLCRASSQMGLTYVAVLLAY
jgi:hypothetical protein